MRPIPLKLRNTLAADPYYQECSRKGAECMGRITWEHALIYAGRQINEPWAIIPLCWYHHLGKGLNKRLNQWIALMNATPEDLAKYPRVDWNQLRLSLVTGLGTLPWDVRTKRTIEFEEQFFGPKPIPRYGVDFVL